ncbi:unnamed protein product [Coregonus sp. 'balchen']|nr:unnamed protein product [Coregonus sp. 'balchen']
MAELFKEVLGNEAFPNLPELDRTHRSMALKPGPGGRQRFHQDKEKELVLRWAREHGDITFQKIKFYQDFTSSLAKKWAAFNDIKSTLYKKGIRFGLTYPARLCVTFNCEASTVRGVGASTGSVKGGAGIEAGRGCGSPSVWGGRRGRYPIPWKFGTTTRPQSSSTCDALMAPAGDWGFLCPVSGSAGDWGLPCAQLRSAGDWGFLFQISSAGYWGLPVPVALQETGLPFQVRLCRRRGFLFQVRLYKELGLPVPGKALQETGASLFSGGGNWGGGGGFLFQIRLCMRWGFLCQVSSAGDWVFLCPATLKMNQQVDTVRKLSLKPSTYVTDQWTGDSAAAVYTELRKLSRIFKDQMVYPLIAAAREAMALPAVFGLPVLPPELLLRVLRLLDVSSLLALSSVNRHLHQATTDPALWRHLYHRDFRDCQDHSRARDTQWRELYKRKYKWKREAASYPRHMPRYHPAPPPLYPLHPLPNSPFPLYPPGIIGGEYDQRPGFPGGILPRPRYDPIGPLPGHDPTAGGLIGRRGLRPAGNRPADIRRGFI